jgi:hypothetical protein
MPWLFRTLMALLLATLLGAGARASTYTYVALTPPPSKAWGIETSRPCEDGVTVPLYSTLATAETRTGVLRSREFTCPDKLVFWLAGHSHQKANFLRLIDAGSSAVLRSEAVPGSDSAKRVEWDLSAWAGKRVRLEAIDGDNGAGWAWIAFGRMQPEIVSMPTSLPNAVWTEANPAPEKTIVDGIPFLKQGVWTAEKEVDKLSTTVGIEAKSLYLLGCTNSPDTANPAWGGGNSLDCFFIGDSAGDLTITYKSGASDKIPLIFGYTLWWRGPYNLAPAPFSKEADKRAMLDKALCVANGIEGGDKPYFLKVALRNEPVESITLADNAAKAGCPSIEGITLECSQNRGQTPISGGEVPAAMTAWLQSHTIRSDDAYPKSRRKAVEAVARLLYAFPDEINSRFLSRVHPDVTEANYPGPKVRFTGPPTATLLTNVYYENSAEVLSRVDETGMVHESGKGADNYCGFGGYYAGMGPFYDDSYTRLRALTLLTNAGFATQVERSIDFFDKWLMYYPRSFPKVQLGGKPVPGHASVIANMPHVYFDVIRWGTNYKTHDFGNPENDGHGLLMLTRWRAWLKGGQTKEWIDKHWEALNEAAEYIPWCLDNPDLSFSKNGLLYNESEGGLRIASMYCDLPCYLGLLAYAQMADASGHRDKAVRWREQASRLLSAMQPYYPKSIPPWGDVWDPDKNAGWGPGHATLCPVVLGMDYFGFDAAHCLPRGWLERTQRTYEMQLSKNQPEWCAPTGMGYGQCYITQAALLLDRMSDARNLVEWMTRFCFAPGMPHPYRAPEGATIASDKSVWRRWGDLGNLYQMAEVIYTTHVMIGIDDIDPARVKLMPRLPVGWTGLDVKQWPIRATCGGQSTLTHISTELHRDEAGKRFDLNVSTDRPVDSIQIRLGPFPRESTAINATIDGRSVNATLEAIGDSKWAWVKVGGGSDYEIRAEVN